MFNVQHPHDFLEAIAGLVKATRLNRNITIEDLAMRSGMGAPLLTKVEQCGICSTDELAKILHALGKVDTLITTFPPDEATSITELRVVMIAES